MEIRATTQEMLHRINEGWEKLQNYLASLSYEQATQPSDEGGWTIKDHCMHLAVWEDGVEALLNKESRIQRMGISQELWDSDDNDAINAAIHQMHQNKSLAEVREAFFGIHQRLLDTVSKLSDEELNLPYKHYEPGSDNNEPIWPSIVGNTFGHYEDHSPWIAAIAEKLSPEIAPTKEQILSRMKEGWEKLQAYLASLSEEQLTQPTDAAGWTVKDHMMHLAVWEDGIEALLNREARFTRMGLSEADWENGTGDSMNAVIQQQHKHKSLAEVREACQTIHERFVKTVSKLSDEELKLPYKHFDTSWADENPVWGRIVGNSYEHYEEHTPWIRAIAEKYQK